MKYILSALVALVFVAVSAPVFAADAAAPAADAAKPAPERKLNAMEGQKKGAGEKRGVVEKSGAKAAKKGTQKK